MKPLYPLRISLLLLAFICLCESAAAQHNITEIVTDYNGYWKSGTGAINPVKPDNSHNLVSFSFNGTRYSTGVNDALLSSHNLSYIAGDYKALPVYTISGAATANTKVGLGEMYDGVTNGASATRPSNNMPDYLVDGVKGLDIGTCIANVPAGTLFFSVASIKRSAIGDGIPDVVITQTADPSATALDRYQFTDINGNGIGNGLDIVLNTISSVGNWVADFYEASTNPMQLQAGYTKTERAIRLWAADFSEFGITMSNLNQVAYFKININGNSDVAFVAYNDNAIDFNTFLLPTVLKSFTASAKKQSTVLQWQTASELNTSRFIVEQSVDGNSFVAIDSVNAKGNSSTIQQYQVSIPAQDEKKYYRLKIIDANGAITYSEIRQVSISNTITLHNIYPNPATDFVMLEHKPASGKEEVLLYNIFGSLVSKQRLIAGSAQTKISIPALHKGIYQVVLVDGNARNSYPVVVK